MIYRAFGISMLLLVVVVAATVVRERQSEWRMYQKQYSDLLSLQMATNQTNTPIFHGGVRQVLAKDLALIDRCQTCHLSTDDPSFVDARQPFRSHPEIPSHPFDKFGCTPCHQGQPWGTTVADAHGDVDFWDFPMLDRTTTEAACGRCHKETIIEGAPILSRGRQLMQELVCEECHRIDGMGGNMGPNLTLVGSKHSVPYLRESISDPKANDTASMMPDFKLPKQDIQALVVAMLSLTNHEYPPDLLPSTDVLEKVYKSSYARDTLAVGGRLFVKFGCSNCHKTGDLGIAYAKNLSGIGREQDSDDIFELLKSSSFDSIHTMLTPFRIRRQQLTLLSEYLEQFKERVVVAAVPVQTAVETSGRNTQLSSNSATKAAIAKIPSIPFPDVAPRLVEIGKALYKGKNCKMCHKLNKSGGSIGPKLDRVGLKRDREWLFYHFKDPQSISPGTRMPNYNFSDEDAEALTSFMLILR